MYSKKQFHTVELLLLLILVSVYIVLFLFFILISIKKKTISNKDCAILLSIQNVCLFHLYPPVTRKRRWRYILDESVPA